MKQIELGMKNDIDLHNMYIYFWPVGTLYIKIHFLIFQFHEKKSSKHHLNPIMTINIKTNMSKTS